MSQDIGYDLDHEEEDSDRYNTIDKYNSMRFGRTNSVSSEPIKHSSSPPDSPTITLFLPDMIDKTMILNPVREEEIDSNLSDLMVGDSITYDTVVNQKSEPKQVSSLSSFYRSNAAKNRSRSAGGKWKESQDIVVAQPNTIDKEEIVEMEGGYDTT